jgi:hypothetical protein
VHASWRSAGTGGGDETCETFPDWPTARRHALGLACLAGVRYVAVQNPDDVVAGEYDGYTNRWREYGLHVGSCPNELEPHGVPCDGELYARPEDVQVRCARCGAWCGTRAHGLRRPFEHARVETR